jgi:hypothetical protein
MFIIASSSKKDILLNLISPMQHSDSDFPGRDLLEEMQRDLHSLQLASPRMFLGDLEEMEEGGSLTHVPSHREVLGDSDQE